MILHSLVCIMDVKHTYEVTPLPTIHTMDFYILYLPERKMVTYSLFIT